jgi:hypothetical protein
MESWLITGAGGAGGVLGAAGREDDRRSSARAARREMRAFMVPREGRELGTDYEMVNSGHIKTLRLNRHGETRGPRSHPGHRPLASADASGPTRCREPTVAGAPSDGGEHEMPRVRCPGWLLVRPLDRMLLYTAVAQIDRRDLKASFDLRLERHRAAIWRPRRIGPIRLIAKADRGREPLRVRAVRSVIYISGRPRRPDAKAMRRPSGEKLGDEVLGATTDGHAHRALAPRQLRTATGRWHRCRTRRRRGPVRREGGVMLIPMRTRCAVRHSGRDLARTM